MVFLSFHSCKVFVTFTGQSLLVVNLYRNFYPYLKLGAINKNSIKEAVTYNLQRKDQKKTLLHLTLGANQKAFPYDDKLPLLPLTDV